MKELIKKLVEPYGPSGFEDNIRQLIIPLIEPLSQEITVDPMGNLIALVKGDGSGLKVMVAAHMDEIGVMVTHITEEGFCRFTNIGGVWPHNLLGSRVQFSDGRVGVIYSDRITDRTKIHPLDKHYIDVGAANAEECPVNVGDAAGFKREFLANGKMLTAKSMDDRIGCVVAIEAMQKLAESGQKIPHDVYFVFSVQEEVGTRGAMAAANSLDPDVGIAIDVTMTGDVPEGYPLSVNLGEGTAIKVKDAGMIAHRGLVTLMKERAEAANIPYQMEVLVGGSTDARSIQIANGGSAAGCISIPCRYVHSQSETVHIDDVENSVKLLLEILTQPIDL